MKIFSIALICFLVVLFLIIFLSSKVGENQGYPSIDYEKSPQHTDSGEPVILAKADPAKRLSINEKEINMVIVVKKEWPNSCLGLSQPKVVCSQVIIPGYGITLKVGEKEYYYRSSNDGSVLVLEEEN